MTARQVYCIIFLLLVQNVELHGSNSGQERYSEGCTSSHLDTIMNERLLINLNKIISSYLKILDIVGNDYLHKEAEELLEWSERELLKL